MELSNPDYLIKAFEEYSVGRTIFLDRLGCPNSNRDPLAEFSERLVTTLVDGHLADSRVQPAYDVIGPSGERFQVKYLANSGDRWVNEHEIHFSPNVDFYVLVFFENLQLTAVLKFSQMGIEAVCKELNKRHPNQHRTLQLTQRNFRHIMSSAEAFQIHGVHVLYPQKTSVL